MRPRSHLPPDTTPGELQQEILSRLDQVQGSASKQRDMHGRAALSMQKVIQDRIDQFAEEIETVRGELAENTKATKNIADSIADVRQILEMIQGARSIFTFFNWLTDGFKKVLLWGAPLALLLAGAKTSVDMLSDYIKGRP